MSKPTPGHERLHAIVERLALSYRGALPWASKDRTREMLIEDCIKAADIAVADPLLAAAPEMLEALKRIAVCAEGQEPTAEMKIAQHVLKKLGLE